MVGGIVEMVGGIVELVRSRYWEKTMHGAGVVVNRLLLRVTMAGMSLPALSPIPPPSDPRAVLSKPYRGRIFSSYAGCPLPSRPLWGDMHLHTGNSFDAGAFGNRLRLEEVYRFARGGEVVASTVIPARLSRPLDWLVVAEHSDQAPDSE
jgi:hypothetical protein